MRILMHRTSYRRGILVNKNVPFLLQEVYNEDMKKYYAPHYRSQTNTDTDDQTRRCPAGVAHAAGLLQYAAAHPGFIDTIRTYVDGADTAPIQSSPRAFPPAVNALVPETWEAAELRLSWLADAVGHRLLPQSSEATELLTRVAHADCAEDPQLLIFGFIGVQIPGPTMGIIKSKRYTMMDVLVRDDYATASPKGQLLRDANRATHGVVTRSLARTDGRVDRLEPEMVDWLFGERRIALSKASQAELDRVQGELEAINAPMSVVSDEHGTALVAVTPVVNDDFRASIAAEPFDDDE